MQDDISEQWWQVEYPLGDEGKMTVLIPPGKTLEDLLGLDLIVRIKARSGLLAAQKALEIKRLEAIYEADSHDNR